MTEQKKSRKSRAPRAAAQLAREMVFLGFGVLLIVQPWLEGVAWLGWILVGIAVLVSCAMAVRLLRAGRMQKKPIAEFESGDAAYEKGFLAGGVLYDFSVPGVLAETACLEEGRLCVTYSFYGRKRGRVREKLFLSVAPGEEEKAREVLRVLNLPEKRESAEETDAEEPEKIENTGMPEKNREEVQEEAGEEKES